MKREDKVLFEQYFYGVGNRFSSHNKLFDFILNLILNSKEFDSSIFKISDLSVNSTLISLYVRKMDLSNLKFYFSGLYYVTDGEKTENRTIYGDIYIQNGKVIVISNITRYGDVIGVRECELAEVFEVNPIKECYYRFSSYAGMDYNETECISDAEFQKALEFKETTLKMIKNRKL